jgi:phosphoribosyl 1,2-cyclic phosphodiesterase
MADNMLVRFWGVRGSVACPGPGTVRYGGNTACVEVRCGERLIIFDAGSGLRPLGLALSGETVDADLFLSHCHLDHVWGLPFFEPCYAPATRLRLWAGNLLPKFTLREAIARLMDEPLFPHGLDLFKAQVEFHDFVCGDLLQPHAEVTLRTAPLNHPNRATGYRLDYGGHALAYITDTEHAPGTLDDHVLALARDVDLMIYDCTYSDEEYPANAGRGHSTWQQGVRLADAAGAKRLAIFHHDPAHDDARLDRLARQAEAVRPGTIVAAEGLTLRFPPD